MPESRRSRLLAVDRVGLAFAAFGPLCAAYILLWVRPSYAKLLPDLGPQIGAFAGLCLRPWFVLALGVLPLLIVIEGIVRGAGPVGRGIRMALAILLVLATPALLGWGLDAAAGQLRNHIVDLDPPWPGAVGR